MCNISLYLQVVESTLKQFFGYSHYVLWFLELAYEVPHFDSQLVARQLVDEPDFEGSRCLLGVVWERDFGAD